MPPDPVVSPPEASPGTNGVAPPSPPPGETPAGDAAPKVAGARDFAALEKAKFAAREARRTAEREVAAIKQELETARTGSNKAAALEKELAEARAELAEAKKDGLRFAVKHGADPNALVRGYIDDTTPEKMIEGIRGEVERVRKEGEERLQQALKAKDDEAAKSQTAAQAQQLERAEAAQVQHFVRTLTGDAAAKCPYLNAEFTADEIARDLHTIQQFAKTVKHPDGSVGTRYTADEVIEYLEKRAKSVHDERAERRARVLAQASPDGANGVAPRKGAPVIVPAAGNGRRTAGPEKAPPPPPGETRLQRMERERAEDLARFTAASAKDSVAKR